MAENQIVFNLNEIVTGEIGWVTSNTAILLVHGMGYQLPLETIDQFGRGLIKEYRKEFGDDIVLKHEIFKKEKDGDKFWFDNVLRISRKNSDFYIDIYEYYWANYTEDKATWKDLNKWLQGVVKGADSFYKKNAALGEKYKDSSPFFDKATGKLILWRYRFFITAVSKVFFAFDQIIKIIIWLASLIPFAGKLVAGFVEHYMQSMINNLSNLLVDLAAYNVVDPKSKFYATRKQVQDGATAALIYLMERIAGKYGQDCFEQQVKVNGNKPLTASEKAMVHLAYPSVIIAAHSLGTQIS